MKNRVFLLMLLFVATAAFAQSSDEQENLTEAPRYAVEMIIFSYRQDVSTGSEIFVPDEPPPVDIAVDDELLNGVLDDAILDDVEPASPEIEEDIRKKFGLSMMREEDFALLNIVERLDRLDAYTPLLHFGWTQSTYPDEETEARPLSSFITPPEGLQGDIKLYLSRYLHLAINLQLNAGNEILDDEFVVTYPVRYRIAEDRIFRSGELRYFDHPKFGVLAKITRVENTEAADELFEGETELLGE